MGPLIVVFAEISALGAKALFSSSHLSATDGYSSSDIWSMMRHVSSIFFRKTSAASRQFFTPAWVISSSVSSSVMRSITVAADTGFRPSAINSFLFSVFVSIKKREQTHALNPRPFGTSGTADAEHHPRQKQAGISDAGR